MTNIEENIFTPRRLENRPPYIIPEQNQVQKLLILNLMKLVIESEINMYIGTQASIQIPIQFMLNKYLTFPVNVEAIQDNYGSIYKYEISFTYGKNQIGIFDLNLN